MKNYPKHMDIVDLNDYGIEEVLSKITNAISKYGVDNVSFEVGVEFYDFSDGSYGTCMLHCTREKTALEKEQYDKYVEAQNRIIADGKLKAYERLKKELGK